VAPWSEVLLMRSADMDDDTCAKAKNVQVWSDILVGGGREGKRVRRFDLQGFLSR
jgi:hypothetical protein